MSVETGEFHAYKLAELNKNVNKLIETVYGNGHQGLTTRTAIIEDAVLGIKRDQEKRSVREWSIVAGVVGLLLERVISKLLG